MSATARERIGRPVVLGDLMALHPGRPERCLCRGSGIVIHLAGNRSKKHCEAMLAAFREECGHRVVAGPRGEARWIPGVSPEEWGRWLIFAAGVAEDARRARLSIFPRAA